MADLPSNAPQMFQLHGPENIPMPGGPFQQLAAGVGQGLEVGQKQQALAQQHQLQQAQIQQMQIDQNIKVVDSLTKNGIEYPALMKSFWPAIATSMNKISPDYGLDPKNPPEDLGGVFKFLSGTNDALQAGIITPQQAHTVVKQGLQEHKPLAVPQGAVSEELPGQAGYQKKFDQLASMGPHMAQAGLPLLEATPEAMQMKSALEQRKQLAVNQQTQQHETLQASAGTFMNQSEQFKTVADTFTTFNHLMQLASQTETQGADTTAAVNAEKEALLQFAQMSYPGTGRPGNMEMLESMEKTGPFGTLIAQNLNRLNKGDVMTPKQIKGLRQAALALYQGREEQQSNLESTYSQNIKANGGDPSQFLKNLRPKSVHSTSKLFPTQTADHDPIIGHVTKKSTGDYQYIGGDRHREENWAKLGDGNE